MKKQTWSIQKNMKNCMQKHRKREETKKKNA